MALPELLLPPGTPAFLADGHGIELMLLHADVPMRTGHSRKRRIYTVAPRLVDVALKLRQAQMTAFHDWFEGPLQAGAISFTAAVANQGAGLLYWQARFEGTYSAEPDDTAGSWRVVARLRLVGEGSVTAPAPTTLASAVIVALVGAATFTANNGLSSDAVVALLPGGAALSSDVLIELTSIVNGAPAGDTDFDIRWSYMRLPVAPGRDYVVDVEIAVRRNWMNL